MSTTTMPQAVAAAVRAYLLSLAKEEDDLAADEHARVPYWSPCPPSVDGHREAARVLRERADRLLASRLAA